MATAEVLLLAVELASIDQVFVVVFLVAAPLQFQSIFTTGTGIESVPSGQNINHIL